MQVDAAHDGGLGIGGPASTSTDRDAAQGRDRDASRGPIVGRVERRGGRVVAPRGSWIDASTAAAMTPPRPSRHSAPACEAQRGRVVDGKEAEPFRRSLTSCMPWTACPRERRCSEPSPLVKARAQLPAAHRCCPLLSPASCPRDAPKARPSPWPGVEPSPDDGRVGQPLGCPSRPFAVAGHRRRRWWIWVDAFEGPRDHDRDACEVAL
jgi:hypothetical protein